MKHYNENKHSDEEEASIDLDSGEKSVPVKKSAAKYPHAKQIFALFQRQDPNWKINKTELVHAEQLYERGIERCMAAISFQKEHAKEKGCPEIYSPFTLNSKWLSLQNFRDNYANR